MGTTFVVFMIYLLRIFILFAIVLPIYKFVYSPAGKYFKKEFRRLFFNTLMTILFEVYFELLFIGMISTYTKSENEYYNFQTFSIGGTILAVIVIIVPVFVIFVVKQSKEKQGKLNF